MDFSKVTNIVIPEGLVTQIAEKETGRILWGNDVAAGVILTAVDASSPVVVNTETTDGTQYRVNNGAWIHYDTVTTLSAPKISIRCTGKTQVHLMNTSADTTGVQNNSGKFKLSGHIADLLDWKKRLRKTTTYSNSCFSGFLSGCTTVTDISELIIPDIVTNNMWENAFNECTALENGFTKLPAKKLAPSCYRSMFKGCTLLKKAPEIMAENLAGEMNKSDGATYCFQAMFESCKALESLSQTKFYFDIGTYAMCLRMFADCTSLKKGLDLSNITSCYAGNVWNADNNLFYEMYCGCTALTDAGKLPTTFTIYNDQAYMFYRMFKNCESLTTAPAFPEFKLDSSFNEGSNVQANSTSWMFAEMYYGCKSLKTLPKTLTEYPARGAAGAANNWNRTFEDCTGITEVPDNYFEKFCAVYGEGTTNFVRSDFSATFSGCTELTKIGKIFGSNYTANGKAIYTEMFYGCSKLESMPNEAWLLVGGDATSMFEKCSSLKTVQGVYLESTNSDTIYEKMFKGCSSLTSAVLDTTKVYYLSINLFTSMFEDATALTTVTMNIDNVTTFDEKEAFKWMFSCCNSLKEIPFVLPSTLTKLGNKTCNEMFKACTSLTKVPDDFFGGVTEVGSNCCESMFNGCTALADVPANLLANITTLSDSCYKTMFYNTAVYLPVDLPATELANNCYYGMYSGCTQMAASTTETSNYAYAWRVPSETDTTSTATTPTSSMFSNIGGATAWAGTPSVNTTYYFWQKGYIKIESDSGTAITFKSTSTASLEYSLDNTTYQTLTASTDVSCPNGVIYLRGLGNTAIGDTTFSSSTAGIFTISCAKSDVKISGDMRALLVYNNMANASTLPDGAFSCLFKDSTTIKDVSKLTIGNSTGTGACYSMFRNCSHLSKVSAHMLPATNVASRVYDSMFMQCSELAEIPEDFLPATTVADRVYEYMFQSCTSLKNTCKINASSLPWSVCYAMFKHDTAITDIPEDMFEVVKETVANDTFSYMFYGATGITELKAKFTNCTYMSKGACYYMFGGCKGMKTVPNIMFPVLTTVGCDGMANMFNGCTALTNAPELPATTFTAYARTDTTAATTSSGNNYEYMFYDCSSLVSPPSVLPATTPSGSCYHEMFGQCTAMKEAPEILITTTASSCCRSMFIGCTSLVEPPSTLLPTDILYQAYKFMFSGCTALEKAPCIYAKTLTGQAAMQGMFGAGVTDNNVSFGGCNSLKYLNFANTITTIGQTSMFGMFNGCTVLEELVPVSSTATVATNGMYNMYKDTAVSVSATQDTGYDTSWTVPTSTGTSPYYGMFSDTKGSFLDEPTQGTTYYFKTPSYSYLKFYSPSKSNFSLVIFTSNKITDSSGNITYPQTEYSFDATTWYQTDSTTDTTQININSGGTLYLRRDPSLVNGSKPLASSSSTASILRLKGNATDIKVSGKLLSMVNYKDTNTYVDMGVSSGITQAMFQCYFKGTEGTRTALKSLKDIIIPPLIANSMYDYFAYNQSNLTDIPKALPYNGKYTNSLYAYRYMFASCPKVTTIPYVYMQYFTNYSMAYFMQNCTSIYIKDTMDDEYCVPWYAGMFSSDVGKSTSKDQFTGAFRNTANGYNTSPSNSDANWYTFAGNGVVTINTPYYTKRAV